MDVFFVLSGFLITSILLSARNEAERTGIPWMYHKVNHHINQFLPASLSNYLHLITFTENFVLLVLVSWLSLRYLERPLLMLRKQYDVRHHKPADGPVNAGLTAS